jgi:cytochrome c peroxidase
VTQWNAFVAVLEMHGKGTYLDSRLDNAGQFPIAAENGFGHVRSNPDLVTSKLPALEAYQKVLAAPTPPQGSFDKAAAKRGAQLFAGQAKCATCHVPPLFTEPGFNLHPPADVGIDAFQADRSPTHMYRTSPLHGLWTHTKGGFYHDGRFPTLLAVVNHYDSVKALHLTAAQKSDLVEYLKSL